FGDPARRLIDALGRHARPGTALAAFNGEQALSLMSRSAEGDLRGVPGEVLRQLAAETPTADALALADARPALGQWLAQRRIWQAGGADNLGPLFAHLLAGTPLPPPRPEPTLRLRADGESRPPGATGLPAAPALVVLDLANMESATADAICAAAGRRELPCV
ncbi:MAG: cobaltochelatase subunit CobN, partial [Ottowia sp.]|nr:cobaltochelatase subunit CobN [Ottowia sp.]